MGFVVGLFGVAFLGFAFIFPSFVSGFVLEDARLFSGLFFGGFFVSRFVGGFFSAFFSGFVFAFFGFLRVVTAAARMRPSTSVRLSFLVIS
jgi:hypothetical protein